MLLTELLTCILTSLLLLDFLSAMFSLHLNDGVLIAMPQLFALAHARKQALDDDIGPLDASITVANTNTAAHCADDASTGANPASATYANTAIAKAAVSDTEVRLCLLS